MALSGGARPDVLGGGSRRHGSLRLWQWVHRWSSLVSTVFLLIICVTGLPLIFAAEIHHWEEAKAPLAILPSNTPFVSLDRLEAIARKSHPGWITTAISMADDAPTATVLVAPSWAALDKNPWAEESVTFDRRTGRIVERSEPSHLRHLSLVDKLLILHMDLFMGFNGKLLMCAMGVLFLAAIVSGVVLYGPFTRKLSFGEIRGGRSKRVRWLDIHNVLGIVTIGWGAVVGITGAFNELSQPMFAVWRNTEVRAALEPWKGATPPKPEELSSVQAALETTSQAVPATTVSSIIYPGDDDGSPHHYLFWTRGNSPLTARLFSPVLVDARTGKLTAVVRMPWYLRALEVSRPLHFGDYGGLPLKIIWALLDLITIIVLGSGLYLWLAKRRPQSARSAAEPDADIEPAGLPEAAE